MSKADAQIHNLRLRIYGAKGPEKKRLQRQLKALTDRFGTNPNHRTFAHIR